MTRPVVQMPVITFLYTMDQIAAMINVSMHDLQYKYLYYHLRSSGRKARHQMLACNIAPDDAPPEWRVSHQDLVRWLKANGWNISYPASL